MEDKDWYWHDDSYKLDAESPLAISRSLWDGLAQSEADSRSLFASTPTTDSIGSDRLMSGFNSGDFDESKSLYADDAIMQEGSPRSKRRRMLLFPGSSADATICDSAYGDPLDSSYGNNADAMMPSGEVYEKYEEAGPSSPSSMWYLKGGDSHFVLDEALEPASHNWISQSFSDCQGNVESNPAKLVSLDEISGSHSDYQQQSTHSDYHQQSIHSDYQQSIHTDYQQCIQSDYQQSSHSDHQQSFDRETQDCPSASFPRAHTPGKSLNSQYFRPRTATPVAYPFALLKPCGAQGDVTLNDINQRISMPPSRPPPLSGGEDSRPSNQSGVQGGSPGLSGKSVVALTKIHTEGNGTITIMRTRG